MKDTRDLVEKLLSGYLIHEDEPQFRPVVITIFAHADRPSIPNFKIKRQSLPARIMGWPSGSLMIPVL